MFHLYMPFSVAASDAAVFPLSSPHLLCLVVPKGTDLVWSTINHLWTISPVIKLDSISLLPFSFCLCWSPVEPSVIQGHNICHRSRGSLAPLTKLTVAVATTITKVTQLRTANLEWTVQAAWHFVMCPSCLTQTLKQHRCYIHTCCV